MLICSHRDYSTCCSDVERDTAVGRPRIAWRGAWVSDGWHSLQHCRHSKMNSDLRPSPARPRASSGRRPSFVSFQCLMKFMGKTPVLVFPSAGTEREIGLRGRASERARVRDVLPLVRVADYIMFAPASLHSYIYASAVRCLVAAELESCSGRGRVRWWVPEEDNRSTVVVGKREQLSPAIGRLGSVTRTPSSEWRVHHATILSVLIEGV